jgi:hypothetical protein
MLDMNPEVRTLWLKALRSGEYKQTQSWLEKDGGFCCLGVLCKLAQAEGIVSRTYDERGVIRYGDTSGYLPLEVIKWAGLDRNDPYCEFTTVGGDVHNGWLTALNDDWGLPFEQIANAIEGKAVDHDEVQ